AWADLTEAVRLFDRLEEDAPGRYANDLDTALRERDRLQGDARQSLTARPADPGGLTPAELRQVPTHLADLGRWNELVELLTDPAGTPGLETLRPLADAIRLDFHFLARRPQGLFQCVWNAWGEKGKKSAWLGAWRRAREQRRPGDHWLGSLFPPPAASRAELK